MSKERLEEIKKRTLISTSTFGDIEVIHIEYHDYDWLIEQAERAIDYDNKLISIEDNKQYVSELLEQNKRYREELDVIGEVINSVDDADEINDRILKSMEEDE